MVEVKNRETVVGLVIWGLIIALMAFLALQGDRAEIYLDVPAAGGKITGTVLYKGQPAPEGRVFVESWDSVNARLIESGSYKTDGNGEFGVDVTEPIPQLLREDGRCFVVSYSGSRLATATDDSDAGPRIPILESRSTGAPPHDDGRR